MDEDMTNEHVELVAKIVKALCAEKQELINALHRIVGMCGDANKCICGRPTGIPAIVAHARKILAKHGGE